MQGVIKQAECPTGSREAISIKIEKLRERWDEGLADLKKRRFVIKEYSFDQFCELIVAYGCIQLVNRSEIKKFTLLPEDIEVLKKLYQWTVGDPSFDGNLTRGIMLIGKFGSGKSLIMEAWCSILIDYAIDNKLGLAVWYKSSKLYAELLAKSDSKALAKRMLFIDDFGRDSMRSKNYGTEVSPVADLLLERYDNGSITHGTGNRTIETLSSDDFYGPMLGDRFKQMFNFIEHKGSSRR